MLETHRVQASHQPALGSLGRSRWAKMWKVKDCSVFAPQLNHLKTPTAGEAGCM